MTRHHLRPPLDLDDLLPPEPPGVDPAHARGALLGLLLAGTRMPADALALAERLSDAQLAGALDLAHTLGLAMIWGDPAQVCVERAAEDRWLVFARHPDGTYTPAVQCISALHAALVATELRLTLASGA